MTERQIELIWKFFKNPIICLDGDASGQKAALRAAEKIFIGLIRKTNPIEINSNLIGFIFVGKKTNKIKILFDKNSLEFKGWETKDAYSNKVSFEINNLKINNQIIDDFFKIPQEKDL